jgi:hypothetical protein
MKLAFNTFALTLLPALMLSACTKASLSLGDPQHGSNPTPINLKTPLDQQVKSPAAEPASNAPLALQEFTPKAYDAKTFCSSDANLQITLNHDAESDTWSASMTLKVTSKAATQTTLDLVPDEQQPRILDVTTEGTAQFAANTTITLTNIQLGAVQTTSTTQLLITTQKDPLNPDTLNQKQLLTECQNSQ